MTTILPKDDDNNPIQTLRLRDGAAHKILVTDTISRNDIAFNKDTKVISLYATEDIHLEFGNSSIEVSTLSHFFPSGIYYDFAINNSKQEKDTHIAAIKAGSNNSTVYISEKE